MRRFVKLKALGLLLLLVAAIFQVAPSIARIVEYELPEWWTATFENEFKLGLDLQGGLHLEYSVAVDEAIENKLDQIGAELEAAFKEKKNVDVVAERVGIDELHIHFDDPADLDLATDDVMGVTFGTLERMDDQDEEGVLKLQMPDEVLDKTRGDVVGQAIDTVRRRVDAMGVAEPSIYPKNRQVVVELPGLSDTSTELRAATDTAATTLLEVVKKEAPGATVATVREDPGAFVLTTPDLNAREVLKTVYGNRFNPEGLLVEQTLGADFQVPPPVPGSEPDPATVTLSMTESSRDTVLAESSDFRRLLRAIERAAVLEMHLVDDETTFRETGKPYLEALFEAGYVEAGMGIGVRREEGYGRDRGANIDHYFVYIAEERETLERFFATLPAEWRLPPTHKVAYGRFQFQPKGYSEPIVGWQTYIIRSRADITGDRIVNANVSFKQQTGVPQVDVKFDRMGAKSFETMSGENVGRKMAIIMDDIVVSDPVFNERIAGGNVVITLGNSPGDSVRDQANALVKVLKSGALPARLNKAFEIFVGADLGKESVRAGFWAFVTGLGLVILFMAIYYRRAGLVAVFALVMNMVLVLAAMSFFQATLTLPGIAGIVLTIGMAVDANVIIFERIREYIREGYTARAAIEAGYDRAFTTILDSQLTTAIAGLVLWQYGSGPIRGFAITLLIGILTSIFTGVFATRIFFDWQANRRGFDKVSI